MAVYYLVEIKGRDPSAVAWLRMRYGFWIGDYRYLLHALESTGDIESALRLTTNQVKVTELTRDQYEEMSRAAAEGAVIEGPLAVEFGLGEISISSSVAL